MFLAQKRKGGFHTVVLTDDGRVFTCGDGRQGQLGNLVRKHNMQAKLAPIEFFITSKITVSHIAAGQAHTACVTSQGLIYSWGSGKHGQLGHGHRLDERFPRRIELDRSGFGFMTRVACGDRHTIALNDSGEVITFGSGGHGQLGHGNTLDQLKPKIIDYFYDAKDRPSALIETNNKDEANPEQFLQSRLTSQTSQGITPLAKLKNNPRFLKINFVEAGATLSACISVEGDLYLFGFGESVHQNNATSSVPTLGSSEMSDLEKELHEEKSRTTELYQPPAKTLKSKQKKALLNASMNIASTLVGGAISVTSQTVIVDTPKLVHFPPLPVSTILLHKRNTGSLMFSENYQPLKGSPTFPTKIKSVSIGHSHVVALTKQGDVFAWGSSAMGQVGHGSLNSVRTPRLVLFGREICSVSAGRYHSLAVTPFGIVYAWGCGESGQLAHGNLDSQLIPRV